MSLIIENSAGFSLLGHPIYQQLAVAPVRIWKWGHRSGAKSRKFVFFWSWPSTFLALKVQLVILVSAFVMVSTVWPVSCWLFFYTHGALTCPAICKSGGTCPRAPRSRRHWQL